MVLGQIDLSLVPILIGPQNYEKWASAVQFVLAGGGALEVTLGTQRTNMISRFSETSEGYISWVDKNGFAIYVIGMTVHENIREQLRPGIQSAHEMWTVLLNYLGPDRKQ